MRHSLLLATAAVLTGVGCDPPTAAEEFASVSELRLQVAASRTEVGPGDTLSLRIRAYNPTTRPVQWPEAPCMPLMYRVYTPDGERIAPRDDLRCTMILISEPIGSELAPGDSLVVIHRWAAIRNYGGQGSPQLLDPGAYSIVGGVAGEPNLLSESPPDTVLVRVP